MSIKNSPVAHSGPVHSEFVESLTSFRVVNANKGLLVDINTFRIAFPSVFLVILFGENEYFLTFVFFHFMLVLVPLLRR